MALAGPDGTALQDEPLPGTGKPVWRVPRDELAVIGAEGLDPILVETPEASYLLEPGGDYLVVARELYLRIVTELAVFKDWEKRTLAAVARREQRYRARDVRR
jgi:hypothetical protein